MSPLVVWILVATVALVAAYGLQRLANRWIDRWRHSSHRQLFCGLCRVHKLDRSSRRLLEQVARLLRLQQPGRLFTESNWLELARSSPALRARATELAALRNRLFDLSPTPPQSGTGTSV